jgi:hypothetical protein
VVVGWPILQKVTFIDCWFCLLEVALLDMFIVSYVNYVVYCERYLVNRTPLLKTSRKKKVTEGRVTVSPYLRVRSHAVNGARQRRKE